MRRKIRNEFERQGFKGTYVEWDDEMAPVMKVKAKYANAPSSTIMTSAWIHKDYHKLVKNRITKLRSFNLRGETRAQERKRKSREAIAKMRKEFGY